MPNLPFLLVGELAGGDTIAIVIAAALDGVLADGLHRLEGGVAIVRASMLLQLMSSESRGNGSSSPDSDTGSGL
jgi:hypothetical protein